MNTQLLKKDGSIRLESSPYTYVRTLVMESLLFERAAYERMLKMSLAEIIAFLEGSTYRAEIDELASAESGVQLVEHAVQRNFRRACEKLRRISEPTLRQLIDVYLWRNDMQNVKTLVRAKRNNEPAEKVINLIIPGSVPKLTLMEWYRGQNVEEVLNLLDTPFTLDAQKLYREKGLSGFESEITKRYYRATLAIASRIEGEGSSFKGFLVLEVEVLNILTIMKLKAEGVASEKIKEHVIEEKGGDWHDISLHSRKHLVQKLLNASDVHAAFGVLRKSKFASAVEQGEVAYKDHHSLIRLERDLQRYLLRKTTLLRHVQPLSVDVVIGYLFNKVNEIRNIFMLIKGKQLGVPAELLEEELIL